MVFSVIHSPQVLSYGSYSSWLGRRPRRRRYSMGRLGLARKKVVVVFGHPIPLQANVTRVAGLAKLVFKGKGSVVDLQQGPRGHPSRCPSFPIRNRPGTLSCGRNNNCRHVDTNLNNLRHSSSAGKKSDATDSSHPRLHVHDLTSYRGEASLANNAPLERAPNVIGNGPVQPDSSRRLIMCIDVLVAFEHAPQ